MRPVIKLDDSTDLQITWVAQHKIHVLARNTIEGRLPSTPALSSGWSNNIGQPYLGEHSVPPASRLFKNTEEGAFRRCEKSFRGIIMPDLFRNIRRRKAAKDEHQRDEENPCERNCAGEDSDVRNVHTG
jgi:hypothetical protein